MTTTTHSIYIPWNMKVEIVEFIDGVDANYAVIKALSGMPFADGAKTTTRTAYRVVKVDELDVCTCTPIDEIACPSCRRYIQEKYGDEIPFE